MTMIALQDHGASR